MEEDDKHSVVRPGTIQPKGNFWLRFILGAIAVFVVWFFFVRPNAVEVSWTQQAQLLGLAREQLAASVAGEGSIDVYLPDLADRILRDGAAFVSLTVDGVLRGCMIDQFEPHEPLVFNVLRNVQLAVLSDARFSAIEQNEIEDIRITISVVYDIESLQFESPDDLLGKLTPTVYGVILTIDDELATYLPSVWETFQDPAEFLAQLCVKAGRDSERWRTHPYPTVQTYRVFEFSEPE